MITLCDHLCRVLLVSSEFPDALVVEFGGVSIVQSAASVGEPTFCNILVQ